MKLRPLEKEEVKQFYNWLGRRLDSQSFYEQSGLDKVVEHGQFDKAHAIFEFGCGTGRLAKQLLSDYVPGNCQYTAIDISPRMVEITKERLKQWQDRTLVSVSNGSINLPYKDNSFDRFIATYVIDLLPENQAVELMKEAHRVLMPDGLICLVSITPGITFLSKIMMGLWRFIGLTSPILVGGCQPIDLRHYLSNNKRDIVYHEKITRYSVAIQIMVAKRR